ncbi:uncharacterized protein LOC122038676 [Zingiber officinale]|uniref:uncharacterized protein LOC122038676 n=1 Tax=Zingiber officinale TaxID=94328 RepID=UPI001C4B74DD|nr:uncharacterized protein LOC122038676 [Zingiber officinale]
MVLLSVFGSSTLPFFLPFLTPPPSLTLSRTPSHLGFRLQLRYPSRPLVSSLSPPSPPHALPAASSLPLGELVERDWSFVEEDATNSYEQRADKARRIIAAADVETSSRVLAAFPTASFVDRLVESAPCEHMVAIHESLFVLAMIKEGHDRVRCWQGGIDVIPEKFYPFDSVFVCYFPGMGVTIETLLASLAGKCSPGARVVLSFDQGREVVEQKHKQQFPDLVTNNLPDRISLEQTAREHLFQIIEFVDETTFYLAVLEFHH